LLYANVVKETGGMRKRLMVFDGVNQLKRRDIGKGKFINPDDAYTMRVSELYDKYNIIRFKIKHKRFWILGGVRHQRENVLKSRTDVHLLLEAAKYDEKGDVKQAWYNHFWNGDD
jgi:hypothetical protein